MKKRSPEEEHYFFFGSSSRLHIAFDRSAPEGTIVGADTVNESECDAARNHHYVAEHFDIVFGRPVSTGPAVEAVVRLINEIQEHEEAASDALASREERRLFDQWRGQLDAREAFDSRSSSALRFSNASIDGFRLTTQLVSLLEEDIFEERRRVVDDKNQFVAAGVVEAAGGLEVSLYLDREPRRGVKSGMLLPDDSASSIKLRRERSALEAVRHQSAALLRPELPRLLIHPDEAAKAESVDLDSVTWVQDLDQSKREAVSAALGSRDFLVVEGPPGTGKTAFIAELVAQTLSRNPAARILIASQTNVALDNALSRVRGLNVGISLLRIGNITSSKISQDVIELTADEQLRRWRTRDRTKERPIPGGGSD
ncbi:MAG: AAA domain-containing protein [Microthrixaceae bacterium]